jgi:demethylmenaquinone methyltransferase/2-methoxy-6-polyprenyl-1,4-benzoquinol methylase
MPSKYQIYERIAPFYDLVDLPSEYLRYRRIRPQLFAGLEGRILDAGVGTGRNIPFYPGQSQVTGIDLSPAMLAQAGKRKARFGSDVELREMDVCKTEFADGSFDAVVSTFLFCVLDDPLQLPALRAISGRGRAQIGQSALCLSRHHNAADRDAC